jgi:mono/diheme cytochrome c family protein
MTSLLHRSGSRRFALCLALALSSSALACDGGDDDSGDDDTTDTGDTNSGALSYAADIQPIWDTNCVACHTMGGVGAYLDLSGDSFSDVVGTPSPEAMGFSIVEAGSAENSYLIAKLRNTQIEFGGAGSSMPTGAGATPLPEATIAMIEQWIDEGALP